MNIFTQSSLDLESQARREYWASVTSSAEEILSSLLEDNAQDVDELLTTDADNAVIYYADSHRIVLYTDSDEAGFDAIGQEVLDGADSTGLVLTRLAFHAYLQDLTNTYTRLASERTGDAGEPMEPLHWDMEEIGEKV